MRLVAPLLGIFWLDFPEQWEPKSPWADKRARLAASLEEFPSSSVPAYASPPHSRDDPNSRNGRWQVRYLARYEVKAGLRVWRGNAP